MSFEIYEYWCEDCKKNTQLSGPEPTYCPWCGSRMSDGGDDAN